MIHRLLCTAVLAFTVLISACGDAPYSDPTKPGKKHVIGAAELLGDTSNLSGRAGHSAAIRFAWNKMAHLKWTTARQGRVHVVTEIVVQLPADAAAGEYDVELLNVWKPERPSTTGRMVASIQVKRTHRWGEKGAVVALHTDGHAVIGMYRRWPWDNW